MTKEHWAVIQLNDRPESSLVQIDSDNLSTIYWNGGPGYMTNAKYKILEDVYIDPQTESGLDILDELELHKYQKHTKLEAAIEPIVSEGWIAPNGKVFFCRCGEHISSAYILAAKFYNTLDGERELENRKWLKLYGNGMIIRKDFERKCTQAQIDAIAWLCTAKEAEDWLDTLKANIRQYEVE